MCTVVDDVKCYRKLKPTITDQMAYYIVKVKTLTNTNNEASLVNFKEFLQKFPWGLTTIIQSVRTWFLHKLALINLTSPYC